MESIEMWNPLQHTGGIKSVVFGLFDFAELMRMCSAARILAVVFVFCVTRIAFSQAALKPLPEFPLRSPQDSLSIRRDAVPSRPFSVVGPRGAVLGQQDGSCELWVFPWKILSNLVISAQMDNYPVPIEVNRLAARIEVRPHSTII